MNKSELQLKTQSQTPAIVIRTSDNQEHLNFEFKTLWLVLLRRRRLILFTTLGLAALGFIASSIVTPKYLSTARLQISPQSTDLLNEDGGSGPSDGMEYNVVLQTEIEALQSDSLALQVAKELNLERYQPFRSGDSLASRLPFVRKEEVNWDIPIELSPERRSEFLDKFHKYFEVKQVAGTRMLEVNFYNPDPELAAKVVNVAVNDYVERHFLERYTANQRASTWLAKELAQLKLQMQESQERVVSYQKQNGILGTDEVHNIITNKLAELNTQLTSVEANRIVKEAQYRLTLGPKPNADGVGGTALSASVSEEGRRSPVLQAMQIQEGELKTQIAQLAAKFGRTYPRLVQLRKQLDQVDSNIVAEETRLSDSMAAEYQSAAKSEEMLRASFERQKQEANRLNDRAVQFTILKHEADSNRELYDALNKKLTEAGLLAGIRSSNVILIDPAYPDSDPSRPRIPFYTALGFALGLFGGVTLAFLLEAVDESVRTPEQIEGDLNMPSLGIVPEAQRLQGARRFHLPFRKPADALQWNEATGETAEAYRALRTSLLLATPGRLPRVIAVTSPGACEGKTTTALNLAASLARQDKRVLLVEADMRCPQLHRRLNVRAKHGLSCVLSGKSALGESIQKYASVPGLHVLYAGPRALHPAELLGSPLFRAIVLQMASDFDHVIIDTPPVLPFTDATLVSCATDGVLLIAHFGVTTKTSLKRASEILSAVNATVIGTVVNRTDLDSPDYHYYSGSKYNRDYYKRYKASLTQ